MVLKKLSDLYEFHRKIKGYALKKKEIDKTSLQPKRSTRR